jgi:hypothetical protein
VGAEREILRGDHYQLDGDSAALKTRSVEYTSRKRLPRKVARCGSAVETRLR